MRRQILRVAVLAVVAAVTLLGVPLALALQALLHANETNELERLALRAAVSVSPDVSTGDPVELPRTESSIRLGVYDRTGRRIAGHGPDRGDRVVVRAQAGSLASADTTQELVVAVPVSIGEEVVAVSRASAPRSDVRRTVAEAWLGLLGLALLAAGCASLLAARLARRVNRPLVDLADRARDLGTGTFDRRATTSGVDEIDRVGDALNNAAGQLDELVRRERAFSAHASHQLRTPLTALRLVLDSALATPGADLEAAARQAVMSADELSRTVDDVLSLARGPAAGTGSVAVRPLLEELRARWHGPLAAAGRPLRIEAVEGQDVAAASEAAVRQILAVLLDNALQHGAGAVSVGLRDAGTALVVDVSDEGSTQGLDLLPVTTLTPRSPASSAAPMYGRLGLALARSLALAQGGRLLHARTEPRTRFSLLLPRATTSGVAEIELSPRPGS